jgi:gliding motility-associated-like protein
LAELYSVDNMTDNFIISDFESDSEYCFVVKAVLEDGYLSGSNKSCLSTTMQRPPQWINADQATVDDENRVSLSFTVDPLSEITRFSLERQSGTGTNFQEIGQPNSVNGTVLFTDDNADIKTINYYRLSAINNCNNPVKVSNIASNIVLSLERTGDDLNLSWNSYKEWMGTVLSYTLFINTGGGFEEREVLSPNDTLLTLKYQDLMYEVSGSEVCFYIAAMEASNPYNISGLSLSSRVCTVPTEVITVPNLFTPNNDGVNDLFKPVLSFTPLEYHLIITDRRGTTLFETRDYRAEWDGSKNLNPQSEGVYLWFLRLTTPSGEAISRTGTVTIYTSR